MSFIPAELYGDIYMIIVTILTSIVFFTYYARKDDYPANISRNNSWGVVLALVFIFFIGTRPISEVFADMSQYYGLYTRWEGPFYFEWNTNNKVYDNLMRFFASIHLLPEYFYILIAAIYFGSIYWACARLFPADKVAAFIVCLGAFSTFSAGTNGIKAGAAASLFLIALSYRDRFWINTLFLALSLGFHHSMVVPIVAYFSALLFKKPRYFYYFWLFCFIMAIAHITYFQFLFAGMTDEHGAEYLLHDGSEWGGKSTGFRIDFVIYSIMPLIMGWYALVKRKINNYYYNFILSAYIFTNAIWLLCMYASFTNRIAYLSWFMYPIALVYPCLLPEFGKDRFRFFSRVAALHLSFTLFMHFIYY